MKKTKSQSGRSMVEMLGVLAVIGVLSIGGVSGYKYAMKQIRMNQVKRVIDLFMLSYETERQKPDGESQYDIVYDDMFDPKTSNPTLDYFCDTYLGNEFCGEVTDRAGKYFVDGSVTGPNTLAGFPQMYLARDYKKPNSIMLYFELRVNDNGATCRSLSQLVKATYGDSIAYLSASTDGLYKLDDYETFCAKLPNYFGIWLYW